MSGGPDDDGRPPPRLSLTRRIPAELPGRVHFTRRLGTVLPPPSLCYNGGGGGCNWDTLLLLFVFSLRLPKEKMIARCESSTLSVVCVPLAGNCWLLLLLRYETETRSRCRGRLAGVGGFLSPATSGVLGFLLLPPPSSSRCRKKWKNAPFGVKDSISSLASLG